eukprot:NODE_5045_length_298_cov_6.349398_g4962_i0.p1 GENE.NODE_5045_length_298_cov_6.349398_g4962_i0~~NODE_5045_length_298_cov_6.349398_g4962_i0.p1  ORF type:complete len:66 (+),score=13.73 NODE_5045_length_298_cov_6.349398_g4962_i0:42-239(+)
MQHHFFLSQKKCVYLRGVNSFSCHRYIGGMFALVLKGCRALFKPCVCVECVVVCVCAVRVDWMLG